MSETPTIPEVLERSLKMRPPRYDRLMSSSMRVELLEEFMLESAYIQGDLTEARVEWEKVLWPLEQEWHDITGWEEFRRNKTEAGVRAAKRMVRPDLWAMMEDIRWVIKRMGDEIERMESTAAKVSRSYTMETGS